LPPRICQQVDVRLRVTAASESASRLLQVSGIDEALGLPTPTGEPPLSAYRLTYTGRYG